MSDRKELFITDLASVFEPKALISERGSNSVWRALPYKTTEFSGVMLTSLGSGMPEDIYFDPKLTGWYKIYVQTPCIGTNRRPETTVLTGDEMRFLDREKTSPVISAYFQRNSSTRQ